MSVLHIVDPGEPGCGALTLRFVADMLLESDGQSAVIVLGHREHARLAQRCGVRVDGLMPAPRRGGRGGTQALRALVQALERADGPFDVVHAWSARAGVMGMRALPRRRWVVSAMVGPRVHGALAPGVLRLGMLLAQAAPRARLVVPDEGVAGEFARAGVPGVFIDVVSAGVDASLLAPHRVPAREVLRGAWGVDEGTLLVGLLSDPVAWGNARSAASIVTLPVTANRDVKLLVHPEAMRLRDAYEWARPLDLDRCFVQEVEVASPWSILAGLDVGLWIGNPHTSFDGAHPALLPNAQQPMPSSLPILWACAAGVPVIAERCAASSAVLRDGETGVLLEPRDVPAGAREVIALFDDPSRRQRLGAAAQREVAERFSAAQAARRIHDIHARVLGRSSDGKDHPATAVRAPRSASAAST